MEDRSMNINEWDGSCFRCSAHRDYIRTNEDVDYLFCTICSFTASVKLEDDIAIIEEITAGA